ncbi:MAG: Rrf2 family transcriptional regulator [Desulfobacterales bacterium]|nr:Rrf2 family transcriptional regulator [Desulfobacterales bacterium]
MKITYRGDYALKAVLDLALHYRGDPIPINEVAQRIDAPVKFLEQVLLDLKRGGFVESRRGVKGGYLLSRPSNEIMVGEVVNFIDGPIEPISCVKQGYSDCKHSYDCVFRKLWSDVYRATSDIVDRTSFKELCSQVAPEQKENDYSI